MRKLFTTLAVGVMLAIGSSTVLAQEVTLTGALNNTAAPGTVISSANYGWWISTFTYNLSNPERLAFNTKEASVKFQYLVDDNPTTSSGAISTFSTNELTANTGGDEAFEKFLTQGKSAGAQKWQIVFSGLTMGPDEVKIKSGCKGVKCVNGDIIITYYYTTEAMNAAGDDDTGNDDGDGGNQGGGEPEVERTYIQDGETFTLNSENNTVYYQAPEEQNFCYFLSTSNVDYSSDLIFATESDFQLDMTASLNSKGNYVYSVDDEISENIYKLTYKGSQDLFLTFNLGKYEEEPEVEAQPIKPEVSFNVTKESPLWSYETTDAVPDFYFEVANMEYENIFTPSDMEDYLVFSTDPEGEDAISLTYVEGENMSYFTGTNLSASTTYYIVLKIPEDETGLQMDYDVTLYLKKYEVPATDEDIPAITLDKPFTVSSTVTKYVYTSKNDGNYYLVSNSKINLLDGSLEITNYGYNVFSTEAEVTAVSTTNGFIYNGITLQGDNYEYTFTYSGNEEIQLTLIKGTYDDGSPKDIGNATVLTSTLESKNPVIQLTWRQEVKLAQTDEIISVWKGDDQIGPMPINAEFVQVVEDSEDYIVNILLGEWDPFKQQEDLTGVYTIYLPVGMVENNDGLSNLAQQFSLTITPSKDDNGDGDNNGDGDDDNPGGNNPGGDNPGGDDNQGGNGGTSGVSSIEAEAQAGNVYDLNGRKVTNPNRGIFIVNGKKVVIR